jgi:hypothetical protein
MNSHVFPKVLADTAHPNADFRHVDSSYGTCESKASSALFQNLEPKKRMIKTLLTRVTRLFSTCEHARRITEAHSKSPRA